MTNVKETVTARLMAGVQAEDIAEVMGLDYAADEFAVVLPGWHNEQGDWGSWEAIVAAEKAASLAEAEEPQLEPVPWEAVGWRIGLQAILDDDGKVLEVEEVRVGDEMYAGARTESGTILPDEPPCGDEGEEHDWEDVSERGHGCGLIRVQRCLHCGMECVTDSYADMGDGTNGDDLRYIAAAPRKEDRGNVADGDLIA